MDKFPSEFKAQSNKSIGLSFIKVYHLWHKKIKDELKSLNLTHPQFVVLASLGYLSQTEQEIFQVEIAKQADMDVMTVSTIIRNLEKAELIRRRESLVDTRAKAIKLTEAGSEILAKALPLVETIDKRFFEALESDQEIFNNFLLRLVESNSN